MSFRYFLFYDSDAAADVVGDDAQTCVDLHQLIHPCDTSHIEFARRPHRPIVSSVSARHYLAACGFFCTLAVFI